MTPDKFPWHDPEKAEAKAREAFAWWEWMRWIFNLALLIAGLSGMVLGELHFRVVDLVFIAIYGALANCCYMAGFLAEMVDQHYFGSNIGLHRIRLHMFILGTGFSMLGTFFGAAVLSSPFGDW